MTAAQKTPIIEVDRLGMDFKGRGRLVRALDDMSFTVWEGEILGVIGQSGAGKTTLLRVLSLQTRPTRGGLRLLNVPINSAMAGGQKRAMVQNFATVFQGFSLLYNRTVLDNTALPLRLRGVGAAVRLQKAREMLRFVGLEHHAQSYPVTLSGGEAQRVAIARALITDPKILFLDEPTSALDAQTAKDILDLLRKIHRTYNVTIVLISHQINVVRYLCHRVLNLENGRIKRLGVITNTDHFLVDSLDQIWADADV